MQSQMCPKNVPVSPVIVFIVNNYGEMSTHSTVVDTNNFYHSWVPNLKWKVPKNGIYKCSLSGTFFVACKSQY